MRTIEKIRLKKSLIISVIVGLCVSITFPFVDDMPWSILVLPGSFIFGFGPVFAILMLDIFVVSKYLRRLHGFLNVILGTLIYLAVIIILLVFVIVFMGLSPDFEAGTVGLFGILAHPDTQMSIILIGAIILLIQVYSLLNSFLGRGMLFRLFFGVYHRPREEEKTFMFLDIKSSTSIAEKIGHLHFLQLLQDFFTDLSEAVAISRGEIYKYVGDEAIIIWDVKSGRANTGPVDCFFELRKSVRSRSDYYSKKYGIVPGFKAGVHSGRVVIGEIGVEKKEISYLGDVINTTARIEGECNRLAQELLVSRDAAEIMHLESKYRIESIGEVSLRGKDRPMPLLVIS